MGKNKDLPIDQLPPLEPNKLLKNFLQENQLQLIVSALNDENPYIESTGFVLTDKPLLVVSVARKETHGL